MSLRILQPDQPYSALVLDSCNRVVAGGHPVEVPFVRTAHSKPDRCHANAPLMAAQYGGSVQQGWSIWTIPDWEVWLEFHSVWRTPQGQLLDTTPSARGESMIVFLPDPLVRDASLSVQGFHFPWSNDPLCESFVEVRRKIEDYFFPLGFPPLHNIDLHEGEIANLKKELLGIARSR